MTEVSVNRSDIALYKRDNLFNHIKMFNLSDNYRLRQCYLQREQVPTPSVMKKIMSPALAEVYCKSMGPKHKIIAGLEPPMKGGGKCWYIPPKDLLEGKLVFKPFKKECLSKLNCYGVDDVARRLIEVYRDQMKEECNNTLRESDHAWQQRVVETRRELRETCSIKQAEANKRYIKKAFSEFEVLYSSSINKLHNTLCDAAVDHIKRFREETFQKMQTKYETFLKQQANMLTDRYTKKLIKEKLRLKTLFIQSVEIARTSTGDKFHDINLEKHVAVEKLRNFLECRNLACQVYVALKERQECLNEIESSKLKYAKKAKTLEKEIELKDFEIHLAKQKEEKQSEFNKIWQKKVCHVVKTFQLFVSYCLKTLPEHADFFIDMEKLMLLQLNETLDKPSVESIFVPDIEQFHTPIPRPHPFYLFCEKKNNIPKIKQGLCPKHCTSSASQLPVIIINKRCIYAACDNFEQFTDKIRSYIYSKVVDDAHFEDNHNFDHDVPVKYTSYEQLREVKLESSLLQVLQQELANIQEVPILCQGCNIPHCFYCDRSSVSSFVSTHSKQEIITQSSLTSIPSGNKIQTRHSELIHEREPKWENYLKYVMPKKCDCSKMAKKHLLEHLPPYMRMPSKYSTPGLLNYETCSVMTLKSLVKSARGKLEPSPDPCRAPSQTKDIGTQCSDREYEYLCTCLSDEDVNDFLHKLANDDDQFCVIDGSLTRSYLAKDSRYFIKDRAISLRHLIEQSSEVKQIFMKKDCTFD